MVRCIFVQPPIRYLRQVVWSMLPKPEIKLFSFWSVKVAARKLWVLKLGHSYLWIRTCTRIIRANKEKCKCADFKFQKNFTDFSVSAIIYSNYFVHAFCIFLKVFEALNIRLYMVNLWFKLNFRVIQINKQSMFKYLGETLI
jgi:hypothetical protein